MKKWGSSNDPAILLFLHPPTPVLLDQPWACALLLTYIPAHHYPVLNTAYQLK